MLIKIFALLYYHHRYYFIIIMATFQSHILNSSSPGRDWSYLVVPQFLEVPRDPLFHLYHLFHLYRLYLPSSLCLKDEGTFHFTQSPLTQPF